MSTEDLLQVFPAPPHAVPLHGLYLSSAIRPEGTITRPCVYADFIASLDGLIALVEPGEHLHQVPKATANPQDWRLYQELAACADLLVTSGRYMRNLARGTAQAGLPVSAAQEFSDLVELRSAQNRTPQPALVIVSTSLDFSVPPGLCDQRRVYIATGEMTDARRRAAFEAQGLHVLITGRAAHVEGRPLIGRLVQLGFGNIELIGGAKLLGTLLAGRVLDRLYLTQAHRMLGGRMFDTLLNGQLLAPPADFRLRALYLDTRGGFEQSFSIYDRYPQD